MSSERARLVNNDALAAVGSRVLDVWPLILSSDRRLVAETPDDVVRKAKQTMIADVVESLIGAVYLDSGTRPLLAAS
jgi:dsRNA-specific ribonuclease